jgi:hypothetical protein
MIWGTLFIGKLLGIFSDDVATRPAMIPIAQIFLFAKIVIPIN